MSIGSSQSVVYALSGRRQSFRQIWYKSAVDCMRKLLTKVRKPLFRNGEENEEELSYRKQIARQLRIQYVDGIYSSHVTLKSRLSITQCH